MFQRILVPLDGSSRAEQALPVAAHIARVTGGSLMLLRVVPIRTAYRRYMGGLYELSMSASAAFEQDAIHAELDEAKRYLEVTAASSGVNGIAVETGTLFGMAALNILSAAQSLHADLIVMCSSGSTGFKRWALDSVAQKVARKTPVPVLILHEVGGMPTNLHPEGVRPVRVLVALDGSPLAERALVPAAHLSTALSAPAQGTLHLVRVLRLPTMYEYGQNDRLAEAKQQGTLDAQSYLRTVEQQLRESDLAHLNLQVSSSVAVNMDIAQALILRAEIDEAMEDVEEHVGSDVICLATHGRGGLERWVMGSVSERVLGATKLPLLIMRPAPMRDGFYKKSEATHERPGKTTDAHTDETEGTSAQVPSWVGLF